MLKHTIRRAALAAALLALAVTGAIAEPTPSFKEILTRIDALGNFDNGDFSSEVTIVSKKPGKDDETMVARYFRRDADDMFTIIILKPETQKGQGYFSKGDDLWFYDPESRKFAYSSLKESFQDSDAQNSDFSTSTLAADYDMTECVEGKLGSVDVYVISLTAKTKTVPVAKRKMSIRRDNYLVLMDEQYSVSGRLMRTIAYPKYQTVSGKFVPQSILIVDNLKEGEKTQLTFASQSVSKLPESVFTKEYLERVNK
jgi:outer membrane lipoprotein-sorting protein